MNFQLNKLGRSFRGCMAYLLHDKQPDPDSPQLATSDRVTWAELRNLDAAAGPHTATRIMIDTAQNAEALKMAAGGSGVGRKSKGQPVFHMSLQWKPGEIEHDDRATMIEAAETALRLLKLDHLQAVIVAHNDTLHPHVHIVVNRVNPETGIMTTIAAPDVRQMDKWADGFEVERGQIVSPNRRRKYAEIEAAKEAHPDPKTRTDHMQRRKKGEREDKDERRRRRQEARQAEQAKAAGLGAIFHQTAAGGAGQPAGRKPDGKGQPSASTILKELGDDQKARHRAEWSAWTATAKANRAAIYQRYDRAIGETLATFKAATKSDWARYFQKDREAVRAFDTREASFTGILKNAFASARARQPDTLRRDVGALFKTVVADLLSPATRRQTLEVSRAAEMRAFKAEMQQKRNAAFATLKEQRERELIKTSETITAAKAAMIERQDRERAKMREAWRQHYARNGAERARSYTQSAPKGPQQMSDAPQPPRPSRTWAELAEDRAVMSGSAPTNAENMRRRDEDRGASAVVPPAQRNASPSWTEKFRERAEAIKAERLEQEKDRGPTMDR